MKRNLFWMWCLFLLVSCLDDKSNYEYKDINDFEGWNVKGVSNIQSSYSLYPGERQMLEPKVRFSIDTLNPDASYAWYLCSPGGMELVANDINYEFKADKTGEFELTFSAKDNKTGVVFSKNVDISVVSPWKIGWMVLSKGAGGESQISMILSRLQKIKTINSQGKEVYVDTVVYPGQNINVVPNLGVGPKKLIENFIYPDNTAHLEQQSEVMVLQKDRCVELDGNNFTVVSRAENEFLGKAPANFEPKSAALAWTAKYVVNQDNLMYISVMSVGSDLHSGRYLPDPAYNGKKVKQLLPVFKKTNNYLMVGIGEDNTFFGIMDDADVVSYMDNDFTIKAQNYIGSYMELGYNGGVDMSLFKDIDGEYVFHAWEYCPTGMYGPGPSYVSILRRGNAYYWHNYRLRSQNNRYNIGDKMVIESSKSGELSMISDFSSAALLPWKNLLAIASGNKLHFFDYINSKSEVSGTIPTFGSEIVDMAVKDYNRATYNAHLAVALKSGEIYVYEVKYNSGKQSVELLELYHHDGFGEIVDLEYKFGTGGKPGSAYLY